MEDRREKMKKYLFRTAVVLFSILYFPLSFSGCATQAGNTGNVVGFSTPAVEAQWIRDGEPIEFEGHLWYPADGIETLLDSEVYLVGEYRDVQVFVDKIDVRPYDRLYTKFGKNKFRYFLRKAQE